MHIYLVVFESCCYIKLQVNLNATGFSVTIVKEHNNNTSYCTVYMANYKLNGKACLQQCLSGFVQMFVVPYLYERVEITSIELCMGRTRLYPASLLWLHARL